MSDELNRFYVSQIDGVLARGRRLKDFQKKKYDPIRERVLRGIELNEKQEAFLRELYVRKTDPTRVKW